MSDNTDESFELMDGVNYESEDSDGEDEFVENLNKSILIIFLMFI